MVNAMKKSRNNANCGAGRNSIPAVCLNSCRKLVGSMKKVRSAILREFGVALDGNQKVLRLALNEAEAVAWQTPFPHLFFPELAQEKAAAVSLWAARQRLVSRATRTLRLAA
jgi:hypothetical protein